MWAGRPNLLDILHTLVDVDPPLIVLHVEGVDEDVVVGVEGQFYHLPAELREVSQAPQQLQDLCQGHTSVELQSKKGLEEQSIIHTHNE